MMRLPIGFLAAEGGDYRRQRPTQHAGISNSWKAAVRLSVGVATSAAASSVRILSVIAQLL